ncbi:hypothetical protein GHT06_016022 [Daphnia sinensis]|uniref:Uncharacterized protein n=1 Tax=Daphnia sinensis TaxID=1820382 RepID=A0AAD5LK62_9CRUS|nr:hypothetical protein GHT06_016022 [Daphnia sinensis]
MGCDLRNRYFRITVLLAENKLPLCIGNLVDQREFHYEKKANGSYESNRLMSNDGPCKLLQYTPGRVAACLDAIKEVDPIQNVLHFVFMGDSRIRQQYYNFLRLIPDFDKVSQPSIIPNAYHNDIEITSQVLGLRLSFKWRPLINDSVIKMLRRWANPYETERPHLIFLSMAVHHMLPYAADEHCNDFQLYRDKLMELGPVLGQLASVSQVIWLNQYPSVDFYGNINAPNTAVFSEKIHLYNKAIRRILR